MPRVEVPCLLERNKQLREAIQRLFNANGSRDWWQAQDELRHLLELEDARDKVVKARIRRLIRALKFKDRGVRV